MMLLEALGTLDEEESRALREHLAQGCVTCAGYLAEAEAAVAHLPGLLQPVRPSLAARDELFSRLPSGKSKGESPVIPADTLTRKFASAGDVRNVAWSILGGAIAATVIVSLVFHAAFSRSASSLDELDQLQAILVESEARNRQLAGQLHFANQSLEVVNAPRFTLIELGGANAQSAARGLILWDKNLGQWHVYLFGLQKLSPANAYQLWFVTADDQLVPAGIVSVDQEGEGSTIVDVARHITPVSAAVTIEDANSVAAQPGELQLFGY